MRSRFAAVSGMAALLLASCSSLSITASSPSDAMLARDVRRELSKDDCGEGARQATEFEALLATINAQDGVEGDEADLIVKAWDRCERTDPTYCRSEEAQEWQFTPGPCCEDCEEWNGSSQPQLRVSRSDGAVVFRSKKPVALVDVLQCGLKRIRASAGQTDRSCRKEHEVWRSRLRAVGQLRYDVDIAVEQELYKPQSRLVQCPDGLVVGEATMYSDAAGVPHKYVLASRNQEPATTAVYYYDRSARLRFVGVHSVERDGSPIDNDSYYDDEGQTILSGGRSQLSDVRDPRSHFASLDTEYWTVRAGCGH